MADIGRNDSCPCGSGKKYKKCHWSSDQWNPPKTTPAKKPSIFEQLISSYNFLPILQFVTSMQLIGANHGHEELFESLCRQILLKRSQTKDKPLASWQILETAFKEFTIHSDSPSSLFTENIIFIEGNYTVYPSLYSGITNIVNDLLEVIFIQENKLPEEFKNITRDGAALILLLSEAIAKEKGHVRYLDEQFRHHKIVLPSKFTFLGDASIISFEKSFLKDVCEKFHHRYEILNDFILEENDKELEDDNPESNPILIRPLIETEDEIIVYMPSTITNSLLEFIYRQAKKYSCRAEVATLLTEYQFDKAGLALSKMHWRLTDIKLPKLDTVLPIRERVFQIDNDKFGYLCFLSETGFVDFSKDENVLNERALNVIKYLTTLSSETKFKVLILFVLAETGEQGYFAWSKVPAPHLCTCFSVSDLLAISNTEKGDPLAFWKFAKAYTYANQKTRVMGAGGTLDIYSIYKQNDGTLFPSDEATPSGMLMIIPGSGDRYKKDIIKSKDEHAVLVFTGKQRGYTKVIREKEYAPIYTDLFVDTAHRRVVENFRMPIWVINYQAKSMNNTTWADHACEAIAFWFQKLEPALQPIFESLSLMQFEIEVIADEKLLNGVDFEIKKVDFNSIEIRIEIEAPKIKLYIPYDFIYLIQASDNMADKKLMSAALHGIADYIRKAGKESSLNSDVIDVIIEKYLQPSQAKMLLFVDVASNVRMDSRKLPPIRYIPEYDVSFVLENLVSYLPENYPIAANITEIDTKISLSHDIVTALVKQVELRIAEFNGDALLHWLIRNNEKCVQVREFQEIQIPAKIACFSSYESEASELNKKEENLVSLALSTRTLIEWIAAKVPTGEKWPNIDDIDKLLAFTNLIINWGGTADALDFGIANPEMGLLPSGRIGTEKNLEREVFEPYAADRAQSEVYQYVEKFETNYSPSTEVRDAKPSKDAKVLDDAFFQECGIRLEQIANFVGILINYGFQKEEACVQLKEDELIAIVKESNAGLTEEVIKSCLSFLTLIERQNLGKSPVGFNNKDIFPWRYTRPLSYLRRPIAKITKDSINYYLFGFRHLSTYFENLGFLLVTGKYPEPKSKALRSWLAQILSEKGKPFRNEVRDWLKKFTEFEIIDYEVSINKKGHLTAEENLGDIDVLAFDHKNKIAYSIECKSSTGGRNVHEMKTEIDLYLGKNPEDKKAKIKFHARRDKWLHENQSSLEKFVKKPGDYQVKSFILSAEQLPIKYLKKGVLPLPVKSFIDLRMNGIKILDDL